MLRHGIHFQTIKPMNMSEEKTSYDAQIWHRDVDRLSRYKNINLPDQMYMILMMALLK